MKLNWYSDDQQQIDDTGQKTDALPGGVMLQNFSQDDGTVRECCTFQRQDSCKVFFIVNAAVNGYDL